MNEMIPFIKSQSRLSEQWLLERGELLNVTKLM